MRPTVSIIIPVFNGINFFEEALKSVVQQSYNNIEIVVVNDGCKHDNYYKKIIKKYISYKDIRYFKFEKNKGVSEALNYGILNSNGKFVNWLSHDDYFHKDKIFNQINFLKKSKIKPKIISCNFISEDKNKIFKKKHDISSLNNSSNQQLWLFINNKLHGCSLLVQRDVLIKHKLFKTFLINTQDYDLWFKILKNYKVSNLNQYLLHSRKHKDQGTILRKKSVNREENILYKKILLSFKRNYKFSERDSLNIYLSLINRGLFDVANFYLNIFDVNIKRYFLYITMTHIRFRLRLFRNLLINFVL